MAKNNIISRAFSRAKATGVPYMVCEIDHDDTRRQEVHPLDYAERDEFHAFGGVILAVCDPD